MEPYDPIDRLDEEVGPQAAIAVLKRCLRFFAAGTTDDFASLSEEMVSLYQRDPHPLDPLHHLYRMINEQAKTRLSILDAVEQWGRGDRAQAQATSIEPSCWRVTLKAENPRRYIEVDAEWNPGPEMDELIVDISPTDSDETVEFEVDWESFRSKYEASWLG